VTYLCLTLPNCATWQPATSISWQNLPANMFATYYETETCRTGGKFFYISDVGTVNGTHNFKSSQAIRSFMLGENNGYARPPSIAFPACVTAKERATTMGNDSNSGDMYEVTWSTEGSGGLSANWSDALPDTTVTVNVS
ncbi:hypothetical protein PHYSODRAFT_502203, partial [Phytophthora sojae]